jgi:uncharacterized membrane protein
MTGSLPTLTSSPVQPSLRRVVWGITALLVAIGLVAVARRAYVLLFPPQLGPQFAASRFAAGASLDTGFAAHRALTFLHIIPASLFLSLIPFQFVGSVRRKHLAWHRWSGRILIALGAIVGFSALVMSFTMNIGGVSETAATTFFAILVLAFLALGFWNIRQGRVASHRKWMIRAFGVALGAATTRPIIGGFFAASRLSPHEFFGAAFWLGFTISLLAAECWLHFVETPERIGG